MTPSLNYYAAKPAILMTLGKVFWSLEHPQITSTPIVTFGISQIFDLGGTNVIVGVNWTTILSLLPPPSHNSGADEHNRLLSMLITYHEVFITGRNF